MTPLSALILSSLMTVHPPMIAPAPSTEATVAGQAVEPAHDRAAIDRFVIEAATRYAGN